MSTFTRFASTAVLGVVIAGSMVSPAFAWHPKGVITKSVQNVTTGGSLQAADTAATAVTAKPGDTLNYVITVKNTAPAADKQWNDLYYTNMTDELPTGVQLVSSPSTKLIKEDLGVILPGKSVTKTYTVKVVETKNGSKVKNTACFKGDSKVRDNPQTGCDDANVLVKVPEVPVTPVTPVTPDTPETPVVEATVEALPSVGPSGMIMPIATVLSVVTGYFAYALRLKRRVQS